MCNGLLQIIEAAGKMPAPGSLRHKTMMRRLRTEAERAKKQLSQSLEYDIYMANIANDMTLQACLSRTDFENISSDLFLQCALPVRNAWHETACFYAVGVSDSGVACWWSHPHVQDPQNDGEVFRFQATNRH